jgi:hypothetical protein
MERYATVPVLPPGVPEKAARIRFISSGPHAQIDGVIDTLVGEKKALSRSGVTLASIAKNTILQRLQALEDEE